MNRVRFRYFLLSLAAVLADLWLIWAMAAAWAFYALVVTQW